MKTPKTLPPVHLYSRDGPKFLATASFVLGHGMTEYYNSALMKYYIWFLTRYISGKSGKQCCPALGGFTSATGRKPSKKATVNYFTPITQSITQYSVVQELLRQSEAATSEVGQEYVLNTFDLGVLMKAMPLIWKNPDRYSKHVITPG